MTYIPKVRARRSFVPVSALVVAAVSTTLVLGACSSGGGHAHRSLASQAGPRTSTAASQARPTTSTAGAPSNSASSSGSASEPPSYANQIWSRHTSDGISFALPGTPNVTHKNGELADGTEVTQSQFETQLFGGVLLEVSTQHGTSKPIDFDLPHYASTFVSQLTAAGATDAKASEQRTIRLDGQQGISFRFSFTSPAKPYPAVWFIEAFDVRHVLVLVQTIAFPPTGDAHWIAVCRQFEAGMHSRLKL